MSTAAGRTPDDPCDRDALDDVVRRDDAREDAPVPPSTPDAGGGALGTTLERAVVELERHVARAGWDAGPRLFALVRTSAALATVPDLAEQLPPEALAAAAADADHLTSVEQEDLPDAGDLEELLGQIGWPASVDGAAVVVEQEVLPPQAQQGLPEDPVRALEVLAEHPDRRDVRIAVAVLRGGATAAAVRQRLVDDDLQVAVGPDLVPHLAQALRATLVEDDDEG